MKIGFLDYVMADRSLPGLTGVSDMIWDLAEGLCQYGVKVHIVGPFKTDQFPLSNVQVYSYRVSDFYYRNIITQFRVIRLGATRLRRIPGLQLIHVPEYLSAALLSDWFPNIPIVLTTPGNIFERISRFNPYDPMTSIVYRWAARRAAYNCAKIIATSSDMEYWWEYSGAAPGKCIVIPLSVNHRHFYPHIDAKIKMGWHDTLKHLVFVGRLVAENHPEYLLEIVKHLAKRNIRFRVHIVGDGPKNNELQQLAIELNISDHIEWHGWVKFQDLPLYYSASDLMIFTRASGAPPRVIPQAMACGCPVASVNNPGLFDYIQPGDNGFIISAENSLEAAKTIFDNLESRSKLSDLGKRAREYTKKNLSLEVIAKRTISEVYQPLLSHS